LVLLHVGFTKLPKFFLTLLSLPSHDILVFLFMLFDIIKIDLLLDFQGQLYLLLLFLFLLLSSSIMFFQFLMQLFFMLELNYLSVFLLNFLSSLFLPFLYLIYFSGNFFQPFFIFLLFLLFQKLPFLLFQLSHMLLIHPHPLLHLQLMLFHLHLDFANPLDIFLSHLWLEILLLWPAMAHIVYFLLLFGNLVELTLDLLLFVQQTIDSFVRLVLNWLLLEFEIFLRLTNLTWTSFTCSLLDSISI